MLSAPETIRVESGYYPETTPKINGQFQPMHDKFRIKFQICRFLSVFPFPTPQKNAPPAHSNGRLQPCRAVANEPCLFQRIVEGFYWLENHRQRDIWEGLQSITNG